MAERDSGYGGARPKTAPGRGSRAKTNVKNDTSWKASYSKPNSPDRDASSSFNDTKYKGQTQSRRDGPHPSTVHRDRRISPDEMRFTFDSAHENKDDTTRRNTERIKYIPESKPVKYDSSRKLCHDDHASVGNSRYNHKRQVDRNRTFQERSVGLRLGDGHKPPFGSSTFQGTLRRTESKPEVFETLEPNRQGYNRLNGRVQSCEDLPKYTGMNRQNDKYRQNTRHRPKTAIDTLTYLDKKEPNEIVRVLLERISLLRDWLVESQTRQDILPLILSVLSKAFSCKYLSCKTADLYQLTMQTDFFNTLTLYLIDLQAQAGFEHYKDNGSGTDVNNILTILLEISSRNPSATPRFTRIHLTLGRLIEDVEKVNGFQNDTIRLRYKDLSDRKDRLTKTQTEGLSNSDKPPDDFRAIDIFPGDRDIHSTVEPFIRKNKTKGSYIDLDHYLDVQFRLLREDFVGPLRDGINEYVRSTKLTIGKRNKLHDIRLYHNVRVISPVCLAEGLCFKLQLDTAGLRRVDWRTSKRLIFGSLLCLTTDNFKTFIIATVAGRELADISVGNIEIRFESLDVRMNTKELFTSSFTMAETTAYFESYRHVLSGLQKFQEGDLPFEHYLLKCETSVKPPAYINQDTTYDFQPLIDDTMRLEKEDPKRTRLKRTTARTLFDSKMRNKTLVKVLDVATWPSPDRFKLDDSQYNAVRSALTKEFALIQGPPGTGKTYIGLKIAKVLLHNRQSNINSESRKPSPMLIVCYTNHALDQFLEGIARFYHSGTILRVGGQSKSDLLKERSLQNMKKHMNNIPRTRIGLKDEMNEVITKINSINARIDGYRSYLLHLDFLKPFVRSDLFRKLTTTTRKYAGNSSPRPVNVKGWLAMGTEVRRFAENANELADMASNSDIETPDIIAMSNHRKLYDERAEMFNQKRLAERREILAELRSTVVAFYYEDKIQPPKMKDKTWRKVKAMHIRNNSIIQKYICYQDIMTEEEESHISDPWKLSIKERWRLYRLWIRMACEAEYEKIAELEDEYKAIAARYKEAQLEEDMLVMKQADVIGLTTTCAARYLAILQDIAPNIVIVEEAAEVLEAHIVTTLSRGCQHLILIGDHKQLRPNPSVYKLATKFNMNVSLFERMILNGVHFDSLEYQHRMRPEISVLMRHIYMNLKDHESVNEFENIQGVSRNIFLVNHANNEQTDAEGTSHSNMFEAGYATALCRYLILQGYNPSSITVLATYASQMFSLRKMMPRPFFEGVTVTVVDNYQGEENDIVILSLVRSNEAGIVGFLKTENRICVALSRARKGFYIIGNFDLLSKQSDLWKSIVEDMQKAGQIGESLALHCQNHPKRDPLIAKTPMDFNDAPEGGCMKLCETRLPCGHSCKMYCHPRDKDHELYKCLDDCVKFCDNNHACRKRCHEPCGECPVEIEKKLDKCGHIARMPCGMAVNRYHCKEPCETILRCGHYCQNDCGSSHTEHCQKMVNKTFLCGHSANVACNISEHTERCQEMVNKTFLCGHSANVACYISETATCRHKCEVTLSCGHACSGSCKTCCNGRFHQPCNKKCGRILVCGHHCLANCNLCLPCTRKCQNKCVHSHCNKLCGKPCTPCMERCAWQCKHIKCTRPCSEPCNRDPCNEWCDKKLKCKHNCIGLCGEPCPTQCRVCNREEVTSILFGDEDNPKARFILLQDCGHIIESRALDKYMKMDLGYGENVIQLKGCPICKTLIRKSYRYGNLINKTLADIEKVKHKIIGNDENNQILRRGLEPRKRYTSLISIRSTATENEHGMSLKELDKHGILSKQHLVSFNNQCTLLATIKKTASEGNTSKIMRRFGINLVDGDFPYRYEDDDEVLFEMTERLSRTFVILTEQEIGEIKNELARQVIVSKMRKYKQRILDSKRDEAKSDLDLLQKISRMKTVAEHKNETTGAYARLQKLATGLDISEKERKMILRTVGLSKGHWYKCPNGHVYAIGECGGATQESVCPECKAKIGGTQHRLATGNAVATEMDGAKFGAFSEEANNMRNFVLEFDD